MTLTQSQIAAALQASATAMLRGCPAEAVYVSGDGVTILANSVSAQRWREVHGDRLGDADLHVVAVRDPSTVRLVLRRGGVLGVPA